MLFYKKNITVCIGPIHTLKKRDPPKSFIARKSSSAYEKIKALLTSWIASEFVHGTDLGMELGLKGPSKKTSKRKMRKYVNKYKDNQIKIGLGMQKKSHRLKPGDDVSSNQARNILIVTRARSGSSFLGDLLNRYPGTFYNYEPLYFCSFASKGDSECHIKLIKQVLKCEPHKAFFEHAKEMNSRSGLRKNVRVWKACESVFLNKMKCYLPEMYYSTCPIFPIRLTKTIRLPFNETEPLLMDPDVGKSLKVIYLFRDPRGIYKSLLSLCGSDSKEWVYSCNDVKMQRMCNDATVDALEALQLKRKYPGEILKNWLFYTNSINMFHANHLIS